MNKEIEELLNKIKQQFIIDEKFAKDFHKTTLNYEETKLLLSYIEQLEKDKKELKDGWQQEIYDKNKVLSDWLEAERKIKQLENNRDKTIEYVKEFRFATVKFEQHSDTLLNILKGDSDE